MADKEPVVVSWLAICMGVISVVIGIVVLTLINDMAELSIPSYVISAIGAAIGAGGWMVWNFRGGKKS